METAESFHIIEESSANEQTAAVSPEATGKVEPGAEEERVPAPEKTRRKKLRLVPISELMESDKNDLIYRPVSAEDPEIIKLAESIQEHGLLEPLVISRDGYIISGHRRKRACELAGLESVKCKELAIDSDSPEFVKLLREHNRQRIKGLDEIIREATIDATPDEEEIAQNLMDERIKKSEVAVAPMNIVGMKERASIKGNRPLLDAAIKVIYDLYKYWPLSDRAIHYQLLNNPPLKHKGKPDSEYRNDLVSYHTLTNVLTRGRLSGEIPWESIGDDTRPIITWDVHPNISPFINDQLDSFMKGYSRDYMQSQPNHFEIVGEKLTIESVVRPVAMKYCIPYTIGRGYSSIVPRRKMAERFRKTGKGRLVVLMLSDFDPDGEEIAQSFARSMRDDFEVMIHPIKVALTQDQVAGLNLPPRMEAKQTSTNYNKFVSKHGKNVFELEAVGPQKLQEILTAAIESLLEVNLFNQEVEQEKKEFRHLAKYRKKVVEAMRFDAA
jgi:hypothetical protein